MQTLGTQKIVLAIIGVLVLGGAIMFLSKGESVPTGTEDLVSEVGEQKGDSVIGENPPKETPVMGRDSATKGSFKDLLGKSGAQKCTVSQSSTISKSTGVFYSSGGKGRGEFESTILSGPGKGTASKASMIMDGDTIYMWDDATKQGMKMSMKDMGTTASDGAQNDLATQMNQSYDYDCVSWRADASLFVPPAGVTITDMSAMMQGLPKIPASGQGEVPSSGIDMSAMCASCDQAGSERDACRMALGCN